MSKKHEHEVEIHGYKGFDPDMKCRGFQFKEKETYEHSGPVKACESGFHLCENPLDVFNYYPPGTSVFREATASGDIDRHHEDSKVACSKIQIGVSLKLHDFIGAGIKFLFSREYKQETSSHGSGNQSASSATGYRSASSATGNRSASSATGYQSASSATGDSSVAAVVGHKGRAMAGKYGCIALAWWNKMDNRSEMRCSETGCGDGSDGKLKAETWYQLDEDGRFVEITKEGGNDPCLTKP